MNELHLLGPNPDPIRRPKAQKAKSGLKKRLEDQQAGSHNDTTDEAANFNGLNGPDLLGPKQSGPFKCSSAQKHGQRDFRGLKKGSKEASLGPKGVISCSKEETWLEDGDVRPGAKGFLFSNPLDDPAWICARGPLLDAHEYTTGLVEIVSFESCWEEGLWDLSFDCPLVGYACQGPEEEGYSADQAIDLVESVLRVLKVDVPRYETIPLVDCSPPLFSVFGRPLLSGGSSGLGDFLGHEAMGEIKLLRVVSADRREWGR